MIMMIMIARGRLRASTRIEAEGRVRQLLGINGLITAAIEHE